MDNVVWGDPAAGMLGRVPKGLLVALSEKADVIIWGTGASEKDAMKESRFTFEFAKKRLEETPIKCIVWTDIEAKSVLDEETQDTTQEVRRATTYCLEHGIERLILVSTPNHIARCLMEALKLKASGETGSLEIMATASDTCFAGAVPGDTVVVEPPHRGDLPLFPIQSDGKRNLRIPAQPGSSLRLQ